VIGNKQDEVHSVEWLILVRTMMNLGVQAISDMRPEKMYIKFIFTKKTIVTKTESSGLLQ
jgi:hypothetical protein